MGRNLWRALRRELFRALMSMWISSYERVTLLLKHAFPTLLLAAASTRKSVAQPGAPRILLTRLDGIGDFVLFTPFLRELRRNYPNSAITLVVGRNSSELATACPHVNRVLVLKRCPNDRIVTRPWNIAPFVRYLNYLAAFTRRELAGKVDLAIQPKWDADPEFATLVTVLSGAPRTVGYAERASVIKSWCNFGQDRLFTDLLPGSSTKHETERNLDIIRYLGGSVSSSAAENWWTAEDRVLVDAFLSERLGRSVNPLVAFGVGGTQGRRHWPYYGELIQILSAALDFTPIILAGAQDRLLVERIKRVSPSAVIADQLPLRVVACLLSQCVLFIGNDSGPMHLAAASHCPTIEISCHPLGADPAHGNSPDRFRPLAERVVILRPAAASKDCRSGCVAETPHCIANISPEEVSDAALKWLSPVARRGASRAIPA